MILKILYDCNKGTACGVHWVCKNQILAIQGFKGEEGSVEIQDIVHVVFLLAFISLDLKQGERCDCIVRGVVLELLADDHGRKEGSPQHDAHYA